MRRIELEVTRGGERLDVYLSRALGNISRSRAQELIQKGLVSVGGKTPKASLRLKVGERITLLFPEEPEPLDLEPEPMPLEVLHEDPHIIVVNKPPGMLVHPTAKTRRGTLVNALLHRLGDLQGIKGTLRPGIVHRLDKGTSGVMVVAKTELAQRGLLEQFRDRKVKKVYLALVYGALSGEGEVRLPIGYHPRYGLKRIPRGKRAREAVTMWKVLEIIGPFSFLEVRPLTGRTHQIRVHMSAMGHPLVGDPLYGRRKRVKQLPEGLQKRVESLGRPALHAHTLGFLHPADGTWREFTAPLPPDLEELLAEIRILYPGPGD